MARSWSFLKYITWALLSIVLSQYCLAEDEDTLLQSKEFHEDLVKESPNERETVITPKSVESTQDIIIGRSSENRSGSILTTIGTWFIVFAVTAGCGGYLYKKGFFTKNVNTLSRKNLEIMETAALGSRQFLVMARVRDQESLLGVGPGFISKLESVNKPKSENEAASFEEKMLDQTNVGEGPT